MDSLAFTLDDLYLFMFFTFDDLHLFRFYNLVLCDLSQFLSQSPLCPVVWPPTVIYSLSLSPQAKNVKFPQAQDKNMDQDTDLDLEMEVCIECIYYLKVLVTNVIISWRMTVSLTVVLQSDPQHRPHLVPDLRDKSH